MEIPESGHTIGTAKRLTDYGFQADAKLLKLQSLSQWQPGKHFGKGLEFRNNEGLQR